MSPVRRAAGSPDAAGKDPLYARRVKHDFAWKLRLTHPDRAEVRVEWAGRPFVFDPVEVRVDEVVILTSAGPDRVRGTAAGVAAGQRPDVIADPAILAWLRSIGPLGTGSKPEGEVDGARVRSLPYASPSATRPLNHFFKASLAAFRPSRAVGPLQAVRESAAREPVSGVAPRIWELSLPGAGRLVHLDLALTRDTPDAWIAAAADFAGADWLLVGCAYGEAEAVARLAPAFAARQVLVTELVNGERRARALPVEGVTPLRDRLHDAGVPAHVFATQASYRFE